MKKYLVCQEDFDHKMWGVVSMTAPGYVEVFVFLEISSPFGLFSRHKGRFGRNSGRPLLLYASNY